MTALRLWSGFAGVATGLCIYRLRLFREKCENTLRDWLEGKANDRALAKLQAEAETAQLPRLIRAAEDAAYETAAKQLEGYADTYADPCGRATVYRCGRIVRALKSDD